MSDLRDAAQQALEALETVFMPHHPAVIALKAALAEEALQRLSDANQEIEAVLEQPNRAQNMRDAGYTRRPTLREMADSEQPEQEPVAWLRREELADLQTCNYRRLGADSPRIWAPHQADTPTPEEGLVPVFTHPPRRETEQEPWVKTYSGGKPNYTQRFTLSCGCPSQYGGVPAYWDRDGSTAFGMICERHWHEYGARSEA